MQAALLVIALVATQGAGASLPRVGADVEGTYILWTGLEVSRYAFKRNGQLTIEVLYDHPGSRTWRGTWSFEEGLVHVAIPYVTGGKRLTALGLLVPVAWGDRLLLVDSEALLAGQFSASMRRVGKRIGSGFAGRFGERKGDLRALTRLKSPDAKLPELYGRPVAPPPFDAVLSG